MSKHIVITGSTRGLGRALAEAFTADGHHVHGCGSAEVDVADAIQVDRWAQRLLAEMGPPDLLINNAATINANAELWDVPVDEFSRVIDVNIKGVYHVIRAFVPAMIERGEGVIVNLSSGWGRSTSAEVAPYCATKWAIEGLAKALAQELPSGMAAVPLNPGIVNTDMLQSCFGEGASSYPTPQQWAHRAAPMILALDVIDNGQSLSV